MNTESHLELAKKAYENKEYETSINLINELLKDSSEAFYYLGLSKKEIGNIDEAKSSFEKSFFIDQSNKEVSNILGSLCFSKNEYNESLNYFLNTIRLEPKNVVANSYVADILVRTGRLPEAVSHFEVALENEENPLVKAIIVTNLGNCVARLDNIEKSIYCFKQAISLFPEGTSHFTVPIGSDIHTISLYLIYYNLGLSYERLKLSGVIDHNNAISALEQSIVYQDLASINGLNYHDAHLELSLNYLTIGNYKDGWEKFESRWNTDRLFKVFDKPVSIGDGNFEDKTVLVYAEQGFGDSIQFIRYLKLLKQKNTKKIIVVTHKPLVKLFSTMPEIDEIVASGEDHSMFDYNIPELSFPSIFGTTTDTIPNDMPYFNINKEDISYWGSKLPEGFKVGVCWSGDPKSHLSDYVRIENEKRICV